MSMERRGTAGAGTIPVIFLPVTWAQGVRGPVLRRDDMRVPTRVQQSGGEPIHTAPARRGLPGGARPPPASVAGGPPASRPFVLGKASGRCVLTPWPAACFGAPTRKWFLLQRHPNRQTEPPRRFRSPELDRPFHYRKYVVMQVVANFAGETGGRVRVLRTRPLLVVAPGPQVRPARSCAPEQSEVLKAGSQILARRGKGSQPGGSEIEEHSGRSPMVQARASTHWRSSACPGSSKKSEYP